MESSMQKFSHEHHFKYVVIFFCNPFFRAKKKSVQLASSYWVLLLLLNHPTILQFRKFSLRTHNSCTTDSIYSLACQCSPGGSGIPPGAISPLMPSYASRWNCSSKGVEAAGLFHCGHSNWTTSTVQKLIVVSKASILDS